MLTVNKRGHPILEAEASIPYELAFGPTWHRFFEELKREKILGTKCPKCERVLVPARTFCPRCFVDMGQWVEVSNTGTVANWAICNLAFFGAPFKPPFITSLIKLDGADNTFFHLVGGFDLADVNLVARIMKRGVRVEAVWERTKTGCIFDIKYFKPL
jgi:uncharacterized OB-fold protein